MFERQRNIEQGKSEPEWMRRAAEQLGDQEQVRDDPVVESVDQGVSGLDTFATLLGQGFDASSCSIDGDCTPGDAEDADAAS